MARKPTIAATDTAEAAAQAVSHNDDDKMINDSQGKSLPKTRESGDVDPSVKDLPPANPLGEPVRPADEYPNISEAGKQAAALGIKTEESDGDFPFGETIVEHPVSPTDANPNPHGQRSVDSGVVIETDDKGRETRVPRAEKDTVEVTGLNDEPVHLGDGRTLAKGGTARVSSEVAKQLRDSKQAK